MKDKELTANLTKSLERGFLKSQISPQRHGGTEKFSTDNQVSVSLCLCGKEKNSLLNEII